MSVPTIRPDDTARARKTDPLPSHKAADKSAETRGQVHEAVVDILTMHGPMNGQELNEAYAQGRPIHGWPLVAFDSPRKRVAELVGTRVHVTNPDDPRGVPAIYAIGGVA